MQSAKQKYAKNKQISIKTSNLQVFKKTRNSTKKQAQLNGKIARLATLGGGKQGHFHIVTSHNNQLLLNKDKVYDQ